MKTIPVALPRLHRRPPRPARPRLPCILPLGLRLLLCGAATAATVRYVDVNSSNPTSPYTTWATAARVIQDAVDVAAAGDEIVVTNGVYRVGTEEAQGLNRVVLPREVVVRSVNGPDVTMIEGATNGVRCAYCRGGTLYNCIAYFNHARREPNYRLIDGKTSILRFEHCCTSPLPEGLGNITTDSRFVDAGAGDFRLRADSPCLNAGFNGYPVGATDLDGRPRIVAGTVGTNTFTDTNAVVVPGAFHRVGVEE